MRGMRRAPGFWRSGLLAIAASVLMGLTLGSPAHAAATTLPCQFVLGFSTLHNLAPSEIGGCVDNQAFAANGDALQHTAKGLLVWRKSDNWTAFTNGYMTWINGPQGIVKRFNDEWFEWEAYPSETDGVPVQEAPPSPPSATEVSVGSLIHTDQIMDNCGPAAISEVLRYYGIMKSQQELQAILRPHDPTGMTVGVVAPYIHSIGMRSVVSTGGTDRLLKALVAAKFPVIAEQWVSPTDSQIHYRPIEGYDDTRSQFIAADPLLGPRQAFNYAEFNQIWAATGRLFIVLYPPSRQQELDAALKVGGWS